MEDELSKKEKRRIYLKEYHAKRKEQGLCKSCDNQAVIGKSSCQEHLDYHKNKMKNKRDLNKSQGTCSECSEPRYENYSTCKEHYELHKARIQETRKDRVESGNCYSCGKKREQIDKKHCNECIEDRRILDAEKRQNWKDNNLCIGCGSPDLCGDTISCCDCKMSRLCRTHLGSSEYASELLERFNNDNRCHYTGLIGELGTNVSIDHMSPKNPKNKENYCAELVNNINNLVFCRKEINSFKNNIEYKYFLRLMYPTIESIVDKNSGLINVNTSTDNRNLSIITNQTGRRCRRHRKNLCIEGLEACEKCIFTYAARRQMKSITTLTLEEKVKILEDKFFSNNCCSAYTGNMLTLGINSSLDHIVSQANGGTDDPDNLVWCENYVNDFKGSLNAPEFIQFCIEAKESIEKHRPQFVIL